MATQLLYAHFDWVTQGSTLAYVEGPPVLDILGLNDVEGAGARFGVYNGFDGVAPGALPSVWATGWIQADLWGEGLHSGGSYLLARMQGLTFASQAYLLLASTAPDSLESAANRYALYLYKISPGAFHVASAEDPSPPLGEHPGLLYWKELGEVLPFQSAKARLEVINVVGRAILRVLLQGELFFEVDDVSPLPAGRWGIGGFVAAHGENPNDLFSVLLDNLSFKLP